MPTGRECEPGLCTVLGRVGVLGGSKTQIPIIRLPSPHTDALNERSQRPEDAQQLRWNLFGWEMLYVPWMLPGEKAVWGPSGGGFLEEVRIQLGLKGRILLKTEEGRSKTCSWKRDSRLSRPDWWPDVDRGPLAASAVSGTVDTHRGEARLSPVSVCSSGAGILQRECHCTRKAWQHEWEQPSPRADAPLTFHPAVKKTQSETPSKCAVSWDSATLGRQPLAPSIPATFPRVQLMNVSQGEAPAIACHFVSQSLLTLSVSRMNRISLLGKK